MKIAVLGTGQVGDTLSNGFLKHGHEVRRGSREPQKLAEWKAKAGSKASTGTFAEAAAWGELVVLAVKGSAAKSAIMLAGEAALAGKTVIDTCNPIADTPPEKGVLQYFTAINDSLMEQLQKQVPAAHFVKAFSCVGNAVMVNPQLPDGPPTMFICGNVAAAKIEVRKLLDQLGWHTADMGGVEAARAIEPLCMLWCILGFTHHSWGHAFKLLQPE